MAIDAIIVDPFLESRMRLKQVANSVCKNVRLASSLAEGIERLGGDLDFGIVCLSSRFDRSHATEFLGKAKKSKGGLDSAYVLVIGHDSANDESTLAHSMLTGFDASLVEPCSVKDFEQTAELATELKTKRRREREEIAVRLLVESALRHLDEVSLAKRMKRPCILATTKLQEITNAVKVLPEEMHQFYFSALAAAAEAATPVSLYTGASERLRRHMIVRRG